MSNIKREGEPLGTMPNDSFALDNTRRSVLVPVNPGL